LENQFSAWVTITIVTSDLTEIKGKLIHLNYLYTRVKSQNGDFNTKKIEKYINNNDVHDP
jgi:hypothetical protein